MQVTRLLRENIRNLFNLDHVGPSVDEVSDVAVDEILADVQHLVLPPLPSVDVQPVLTVLGNLWKTTLKPSSNFCISSYDI